MDILFISLFANDIDHKEEQASTNNESSEMRRITQELERGARILHSWVLTHSGEIISKIGNVARVSVPLEYVSELDDVVKNYESAVQSTVAVGVGLSTNEADRALQVSIKTGGSCVTFYTEEVEKQLEEQDEEDKEDGIAHLERYLDKSEHPKQKQFEQHVQAKESIKRKVEEDQQATESAQTVKSQVLQLLQELKEQAPVIEQLKEQAPDVYQSVTNMVNGVALMARELAKQKPEEMAKAIKAKHHKMNYMPNFHLPTGPGTSHGKGGKLKVMHSNGKTTWISVRAGMIMSPEGRPTSSRHPSGYKPEDHDENP